MIKSRLMKVAQPLLSVAVCYSALVTVESVINVAGVSDSLQVIAQEQSKPQETRKTPAMRNPVYEKLAKAQEAVEAKDFPEAMKVLGEMLERHNKGRMTLNSYELANLYGQYAFIYYTQEKFDQAITYNEKVVAQPDIPLGLELGTRYTIAQLYFVVENYPKAVKALEAWFKVEQNPQPNAYVLLAQGYYQINQYDKALSSIEEALVVAKAKGKEPKEQWYLLMRALYFEKNDMKKVAWVLEEMARRWPKRDYFVQLSSVYAQLNDEKRQLLSHDIAFEGWGLDSESTMLNMGYLYMGNDIPYQGATVIEDGLKKDIIRKTSKNYSTLAQAYNLAQESKKAIPFMEKAAETADNGEPWARLAGIYFDNERYQDSMKAARTAFEKGGLKRPEQTYVLMGMSLFNLDKLPAAKKEFRKAIGTKSTEKVAKQWIKYIDSEIRRRDALKKV